MEQHSRDIPDHVCTAAHPWAPEREGDGWIQHPDAQPIGPERGDEWSGYTQEYQCPNCDERFDVALAQEQEYAPQERDEYERAGRQHRERQRDEGYDR